MNRLRELDFLRGIAIVLVLLRHRYICQFTENIGWIGVDLFFVLSGFLVSGLLFKEFKVYGNIQPKRFLIRRGFKIYPIYYIFNILYLIPILIDGNLKIIPLLSDLTFTQNYANGWGYLYFASWSLAVEEHFYFAFTILLWLGIKYNKIILNESFEKRNYFQILIIGMLIFCFYLRLISNIEFPEDVARNFTMTHLRIDSLLAGVYIAYLYYFRLNVTTQIFNKYKKILLSIAFLCLVWTPFFDAASSFFVKTIGFTLLYISFGILLLYFILTPNINKQLNYLFGSSIINFLGKVGYCSYSIYIIHSIVIFYIDNVSLNYNLSINNFSKFLITAILSILIGMIMTYKIEAYFLKIRNTIMPSRI